MYTSKLYKWHRSFLNILYAQCKYYSCKTFCSEMTFINLIFYLKENSTLRDILIRFLMSFATALSSSIRSSRWAHWFYARCGRCQEPQRFGVGYTPCPDVVVFHQATQCKYYHRLHDIHAGSNGRGHNLWDLRKCTACSSLHGDWIYLDDIQYSDIMTERRQRNEKNRLAEENKSDNAHSSSHCTKHPSHKTIDRAKNLQKMEKQLMRRYPMKPIVEN